MAKKIDTLNQNKIKTFDLAINKLHTLELGPLGETHEDNTGQVATNIKFIDSGVCGFDFYKITVATKSDSAQSKIQSIWAEPNSRYSTCETKAPIRPGRQSFLIIK